MEVLLDKQPEKYIRNLNEPMKAYTAKLREDLHLFIDTMPERNLQALWPIVSILAEPEYAIETDLTDEEHALIEESVNRYHANPASFVPLKSLL